jgi:glycosyltransferase involved in cell wall biosynthesis
MKVLALTPWPIIPAESGGKARCYNLLKELDDVTVYALDWEGDEETVTRVGNLLQVTIPADTEAKEQAKKLFKSIGLKSYDAIPSLTKTNLKTFKEKIDQFDPDIIVLEHPWLIDLIGDRPYIYDAHNCETKATAQLFGIKTYDFDLVKSLEAKTIREAEHIIYCSKQDLELMDKIQHITCATTLIPNGTHLPSNTAEGNNKNLIFVGSMYLPNAIAAQQLADLAPQLPDYTITIVGGCSRAVITDQPNVRLLGHISDKQLHEQLLNTSIFINLTTRGAGTQLKVAQALAYGIPVISTEIGARGYVTPHITTPETILDSIQHVTENWEGYSYNARLEAEGLEWSNLGKELRKTIYALQ